VTASGTVSPGSVTLGTRAFDDARPEPPTWNPAVVQPDGSVALSWSSPVTDLRSRVERRFPDSTAWESRTRWLERGDYAFTDTDRVPGVQFVYRLRVMDTNGKVNNTFIELTA